LKYSPDALARIKAAIAGLANDFDVTTDAALQNGQYVAVPPDEAGFVFARSTLPGTSRHDWTDSLDDRKKRGAWFGYTAYGKRSKLDIG
jgi:hypothetical protein